ncbi:SMP-30/gluconolactonase/LRE family protein [Nocardia sp. NPDC056000]|uniref:SMP-30/gluconolactonase/LRE family protein n=1 Tax=Nocardia sp. NPDC056000 TaxID=3345674 RepID=UPI0035D977F8
MARTCATRSITARLRCGVGVFGVGILAAALPLSIPAAEATAETPGCAIASTTTLMSWSAPGRDWVENIGYDRQGNLWVTHLFTGNVERYSPSGELTATVWIPFPAGIRQGPDGLLYINYGDAPTSPIPGWGFSGVVRLDPAAESPSPELFAVGASMSNGSAFDSAGNLYITDTLAGITRIRPDGVIDRAWSDRARLFGANGLSIIGDTLYVSATMSLGGKLWRMSVADPGLRSIVTQLNPDQMPALPDGLEAAPDGMLYAATALGRLVQVNPTTGATCDAYHGEPLTSVTVGPDGRLVLGTELGNVLRLNPEL